MLVVKQFLKSESGAVTIDWVALAAGILLLGIAVVYAIFGNGVAPMINGISTELQRPGSIPVGPVPSLG